MNLIITWILNAVALWLTALLGIGIAFNPMTVGSVLLAALVLGLVNAIIRPIMVFLSLPITFLTLGLFLLVINALVLYIVSAFTALEVKGFWGAILGAIVLSIISSLLSWAFGRR
jgi:putative membrane protein